MSATRTDVRPEPESLSANTSASIGILPPINLIFAAGQRHQGKGLLNTLPRAAADRHSGLFESIVRQSWSKRPGIVGVSFAIPDQHASTLDTEESRQSGNRFAEEWLLLVEGISERSLLDLARAELTRMVRERWGLSNGDSPQIFQLQVRMGRECAE
jgi:hypothetical protein